MTEEWRPVVGYEGLYEISNLGRVKSVERTMTSTRNDRSGNRQTYQFHVKEKILKQGRRQDGYADVSLSNHGTTVLHCVHRLLAEAWIPNPHNLGYVNHKDLDKTNNSLDNLEWVSNAENVNHAVKRYANTKQSKPIYCRETDTVYPSMGQCEKALGLKQGVVSLILKGQRKSSYHLSLATQDQIEQDKASIDAECSWTFSYKKKGRLHPVRKIKCIDTQEVFDTLVKASEVTGICADTIRDSIRQRRTCKGLTFYYLDDAPGDEVEYQQACAERYYNLTHHWGQDGELRYKLGDQQ